MTGLFDKTFFKLFCGFAAIIFFSLTVFAVASVLGERGGNPGTASAASARPPYSNQ